MKRICDWVVLDLDWKNSVLAQKMKKYMQRHKVVSRATAHYGSHGSYIRGESGHIGWTGIVKSFRLGHVAVTALE